jgi:hypothetical protein
MASLVLASIRCLAEPANGVFMIVDGKELLNERTNTENRYLKKVPSIPFQVFFSWAMLFLGFPVF